MNKEERREYNREYYLKNRDRIIQNTKDRLKETNYATQKRPEARKRICIKRETRRLYPLIGKKCVLCGRKATEHHHITEPIKVDAFIYMCHECHTQVHRFIKQLNSGGKK